MGCDVIAAAGGVDVVGDVKRAISWAPFPIRGLVHLASADYRRGLGMPASTVVVSPLSSSEAGFVEEKPAATSKIRYGGYAVLVQREVLRLMEYAIRSQLPDSTGTFLAEDLIIP
ncbi:hypothetical protein QBC43DRAFT_286080 [Cladorrhinum sp. PSN259]|nr:hypothetical protein QBC43DRAFT_286080 [Cladorrhinum sp. PSN259]